MSREPWSEQGQGDRRVEIGVTRGRAGLESMRGRFDEAREQIARAKARAGELGDQVALASVLRDSGLVEMRAGDPIAAEREMRPGFEILERIGDLGHLSSSAPDLGEDVYAQRRYDETLALGQFAERIAIRGDVDAEVRGHQLRAKALARRGRLDEAEVLASEAVRLAASTDYLELHALALLSLAEVRGLANRKAEAAAAVREARELYRRKGNVVGDAQAASLLEGSSREPRRPRPATSGW